MSLPRYLKEKRGRYFFQRRVPKDVLSHKHFKGKPAVVEKSLHTSDPTEARLRAAEESAAFERLLAEARGSKPAVAAPSVADKSAKGSPDDVKPITPDWIEWAASEHYFSITSPITSAFEYAGLEHDDSEERLLDTESFELADLMAREDDLKRRKIRTVRKTALRLLEVDKRLMTPLERDRYRRLLPHPVEQIEEFRTLCQSLIDAELDAVTYIRKLYNEGKRSKELDSQHRDVIRKTHTSKAASLDAVASAYLANSPGVTDEWANRVRRIIDICASLGTPTEVAQIRKTHIRNVFDTLTHVPRNWSLKYPGKTLEQAIELGRSESAAVLSPNTIRDGYLAPLKAVLSYAEERDFIDANPTRSLKIAKARNDGRGTGFDPHELNALFSLPLFSGCKDDNSPLTPGDHLITDHRFWAPIVALFTGARTAEIAQLKLDEVILDGSLPHFIIQASDGSSLKTDAATRRIPIHTQLLELGLRQYCKQMKEAGEKRLFPNWTKPKGKGYADARSQRYFRRSIIPLITKRDHPRPNFHSFRNTMKGEMVEVGMTPEHQDLILGHEHAGMTRIYLKTSNLAALTESLSKVRFDHVDFSRIMPRA